MFATTHPTMGLTTALWICAALAPLMLVVAQKRTSIRLSSLLGMLGLGLAALGLGAFYDYTTFAAPSGGSPPLPALWESGLPEVARVGAISAAFAVVLWLVLPDERPVEA